MKILRLLLLVVVVAGIYWLNCELDHGIEPIRSNIQGVVKYTGDWPGTPAEVRMIAATKFPPADISDLIIGENIPVDAQSYSYSFYLKPGDYKLVGVAWREVGSTWDIVSICGVHFSGSDSLTPAEIILPTDTSTIRNVEVLVNRSEARKVSKAQITGMLHFEGTWPDSIADVRVIASAGRLVLFPATKLPKLLDLSFSAGIPVGIDSATYTISAFPATYYATAVIFFRAGQSLSTGDLIYSLKKGGLNTKQYKVPADSIVAGPDFHIKF